MLNRVVLGRGYGGGENDKEDGEKAVGGLGNMK